MTQIAIENAAWKAWPALEEKQLSYGVLRYANGISRRANSLNVRVDQIVDPARVRVDTETFFTARGLPSIVRIVEPMADRRDWLTLDSYLSGCEYRQVAKTAVMHCILGKSRKIVRPLATPSCQQVDVMEWLQAWHVISCKTDMELLTHTAMMQKLASPAHFLVLRHAEGEAVSCGMAVRNGDLLGVFGIATADVHRGLGYATAVVGQLLRWGESVGIKSAYLQVEQDNCAAVSVYRKLGFRKLYDYWYREKQFNTKHLQRQL